jgi:hypothetical protein
VRTNARSFGLPAEAFADRFDPAGRLAAGDRDRLEVTAAS